MNDHQWDLLLTAKLRIFSRYKRETFDAIHYVPVGKKKVQIYVFFHTDEELRDHETSGLTQDIRARFDQELNAVGLGPAQGIPNRFEFDSFENVVRNFEGNYYYRLK